MGGERHYRRVGAGFVPGVRLAGEFYAEVVRPLLEVEFPGLPYAAALIGAGSEVLGFDTERSTDHDWGRGCWCSARTRRPNGSDRQLGPAGTADQVLDSKPALGDLRYARAVTSVSGI